MSFRYQPNASDGLDSLKGPDPLTDNWTYDSAIDLFSWNPMLPDPFVFDLPDDLMSFEPRDLPADMWAPPSDVGGIAIGNHMGEDAASESISVCTNLLYILYSIPVLMYEPQDPESDDHDQPLSPTACAVPFNTIPNLSPKPAEMETQEPGTDKPRYASSSPEIAPQDSHPPFSPPTRSTRRRSSGEPPVRNAAKRAAHNVIEKRYRTNMNAKFVALEKSMDSGSANGVHKPASKSGGGNGGSASLKKSEILSNAITYMHQLKEENRYLQKELAVRQNLMPGGIWRRPAKCETSYC